MSEVWVRYTTDSSEEWRKFSILKHGAVLSLPGSSSRKYGSSLHIKATKAADPRVSIFIEDMVQENSSL